MKLMRLAAVAATGIALSGCATIISGTSENISVNTPPTTGASCTLSNGEGTWNVVSPGVARVERAGHDMGVHCSKPGFQDGTANLVSGFEPWALGNIIFGGVIGIVVDIADGAVHKYPRSVDVPMQPVGPPPPPPPPPPPGSPPTS